MGGRKCSQCSKDGGNNSPSCKNGCTEIKLFGVQIAVPLPSVDAIRKSKSLGNLQSFIPQNDAATEPSGYLSDGYRKRGKSWSEDEHRSFLAGLEKLGKGDWKGIANNFVPSRTSTQVASHAQKYFNRLSKTEKKRRRTSVFDIALTHNQPSNKDDETSLVASSSAAAPNNVIESKQQAKKTATGCLERPPLSPMNRHGIPDYTATMLYQARGGSFTQVYPTQTQAAMPTISWVPVVYFSRQSSVSPPIIYGFVPEGSAGPVLHDDLNHNIRKLTL